MAITIKISIDTGGKEKEASAPAVDARASEQEGRKFAAEIRNAAVSGRAESSLSRIGVALANIEKRIAQNPSSHELKRLEQNYISLQMRANAILQSLGRINRQPTGHHDEEEHHDNNEHHHEECGELHHADEAIDHVNAGVLHTNTDRDRHYILGGPYTTGHKTPFMRSNVSFGGFSRPGFADRDFASTQEHRDFASRA